MFSSTVLCLSILFLVFFIDNSSEQHCSVFLNNIKQCRYSNLTDNIKVFTVVSEENDGYKRFINSAKYYNIEVTSLGLGEKWQGDFTNIINLRKALEPFQNDTNTIIIYTQSYDVVFTSGVNEIVHKFKNMAANILFSAQAFCPTNEKLNNTFAMSNSAQCLNAGMFIGYAAHVYQMLLKPLVNHSDERNYYTEMFLDQSMRIQNGVHLDTKSEIFQTLDGATADLKLDLDSGADGELINLQFLTKPNIFQGNGKSNVVFNSMANYLAGSYRNVSNIGPLSINDENVPMIVIAIFVEKIVPFFQEFLNKISALIYPKQNIDLFIYCNIPYHQEVIRDFIQENEKQYNSIFSVVSSDEIEEREARKFIIKYARKKLCQFLLVIDNDVQIDDPNMLKELISYNKSFIAPLLVRPNSLISNFWGALTNTKYYETSHDYANIVKRKLRGIWNVPHISSCYLIKYEVLSKIKLLNFYVDSDMSLCDELRNAGIFMNILNTKEYGHLIDYDDFNTSVVRPEFFTLLTNPKDWQNKYIRSEYFDQFLPGYQYAQPCPDVYWFPIVTDRFCDDLIAIAEDYGVWTGGTYANGEKYGSDPVPTSDIYMYQVGLRELWLDFLKRYVRPLQESVYPGYYQNPPRSLVNFIVRYKPDEQSFLRPHHDTSTFTINIALNRAYLDYQGGGCKFVRYNCSVTDTKKGWMLMHPGQLTHLHEGLRVTNGTRYIMVSFVNPNN